MTLAVCTRCGAKKRGALTPCPDCQFDPTESDDKAKAMVLTDHYLSQENLEGISERIKAGKSIDYPMAEVQQLIQTFEENPEVGQIPKSIVVGCVLVTLLLITLVAVVVWYVFHA